MVKFDRSALPELDGVEHRFVNLPGLRMHVAEAGSGEPLLMLHGFPQHWWEWRKVLPALAAQYGVICPDLRGAGWTDAPRHGYGSDQLLADVVALLDALGIEKVRVVGHDWGGILGFRLCLAHPERVERYLCFAAPHPYSRLSPRLLLEMWRLWPVFTIATPLLGQRLLGAGAQRLPRYLLSSDTTDPDVWSQHDIDIFVSRLRDPARARAGSALYRNFVLREAMRSLAGKYRGTPLRTPTLGLYGSVLYGGDDGSGTEPHILGGYENYADDFTWEHVPGSGYYLADETPEVLVARALDFFAAASRPTA